MHTAPYFAAFGILTIVHAARVIRLRAKHKVSIGDGGFPDLQRMIRVFGNHAEYVPIGLILLIALEFVEAPIWYLHLTGGALLLGRVLHAIGLSGSVKMPNPGRLIGMVLTFLSILLASIGVMLFSIVQHVHGAF